MSSGRGGAFHIRGNSLHFDGKKDDFLIGSDKNITFNQNVFLKTGLTPTDDQHLVTKKYAEGLISGGSYSSSNKLDSAFIDFGQATDILDDPLISTIAGQIATLQSDKANKLNPEITGYIDIQGEGAQPNIVQIGCDATGVLNIVSPNTWLNIRTPTTRFYYDESTHSTLTCGVNGDLSISTTGTSVNMFDMLSIERDNTQLKLKTTGGAYALFTMTGLGLNINTSYNRIAFANQVELSDDLKLLNGAQSCTFTVSAGGDLTITPTGGDIGIVGALDVTGSLTAPIITTHSTDINTNKSNINTNTSKISTNTTDITTHGTDITNLQTDITTHGTDITTLQTDKLDIDGTDMLQITRTTEQTRLRYDDLNYASFSVSSAGTLDIVPSGAATTIDGELVVSSDLMTDGHLYVGTQYSDTHGGKIYLLSDETDQWGVGRAGSSAIGVVHADSQGSGNDTNQLVIYQGNNTDGDYGVDGIRLISPEIKLERLDTTATWSPIDDVPTSEVILTCNDIGVSINHDFNVSGNAIIEGDLTIGTSAEDQDGGKIYIKSDENSGGATTVIGVHFADTQGNGNDTNEMIIFQGNNVDGHYGVDKIRLISPMIQLERATTSADWGPGDDVPASETVLTADDNGVSINHDLNVSGDTTIEGDLTVSGTVSAPRINAPIYSATVEPATKDYVITPDCAYQYRNEKHGTGAHRGICWTGSMYIVVDYTDGSDTAGLVHFYNHAFETVHNKFNRTTMKIPYYSHGGSWDGRYLYTIVSGVIYILDLDVDSDTANIIATLNTTKNQFTYSVEYVAGYIYFTSGTASGLNATLHCLRWTGGDTFEWVFQDIDRGIWGAETHVSICAVGSYLYMDSSETNDSKYMIMERDGTIKETYHCNGDYYRVYYAACWNGFEIVAITWNSFIHHLINPNAGMITNDLNVSGNAIIEGDLTVSGNVYKLVNSDSGSTVNIIDPITVVSSGTTINLPAITKDGVCMKIIIDHDNEYTLSADGTDEIKTRIQQSNVVKSAGNCSIELLSVFNTSPPCWHITSEQGLYKEIRLLYEGEITNTYSGLSGNTLYLQGKWAGSLFHTPKPFKIMTHTLQITGNSIIGSELALYIAHVGIGWTSDWDVVAGIQIPTADFTIHERYGGPHNLYAHQQNDNLFHDPTLHDTKSLVCALETLSTDGWNPSVGTNMVRLYLDILTYN